MAEIEVVTRPIHAGHLMNIGRAVLLHVNGHEYRLWHEVRDYDRLEQEASALAADLGAKYVHVPNWKEGDPV